VAPADVDVRVEGQWLVVFGRRQVESSLQIGRTVHVEREQGEFCRRLRLEHPVDSARMESHWERGLLIVRLPKQNEVLQRPVIE
jgi:HSP20 family molecular chaperone IbpA